MIYDLELSLTNSLNLSHSTYFSFFKGRRSVEINNDVQAEDEKEEEEEDEDPCSASQQMKVKYTDMPCKLFGLTHPPTSLLV